MGVVEQQQIPPLQSPHASVSTLNPVPVGHRTPPHVTAVPTAQRVNGWSFWVVLVAFVLAYLWNDVMSGVAMWRMPKPAPGWPPSGPNPALPDIGFDVLPYPTLSALPTGILLVSMGASAVLTLSLGWATMITIAIRFMAIDAVLLALRGFTIVSTSLNNPDPRCFQCGGSCPPTMWGCVMLTLSKFPFFSCGDLMFSGHTVHYVLMALIWSTYYIGGNKKRVLTAYWIVTVFGVSTLLSMRYHYTIDVLIAFTLTVVCWVIYHYMALQLLPMYLQYASTQTGSSSSSSSWAEVNWPWPVRVVARIEQGIADAIVQHS